MCKKLLCGIFLVFMVLVNSGCVKINVGIDIEKDKSMDFSYLMAVDTSVFQEELEDFEEIKKEFAKYDFEVLEYNEGNLKGLRILKHINNIDDVSSLETVDFDMSNTFENGGSFPNMFQVKKGFLMDTYTANFKMSNQSSNMNFGENDIDADFNSPEMGNMIDSVSNTMELIFEVHLPYSAKSSNATKVNNKSKELIWELSMQNQDDINFSFVIYNLTLIYLILGGVFLVILLVVLFLILKKRKKKAIVSEKYAGDGNLGGVVNPLQNLQNNIGNINNNGNISSLGNISTNDMMNNNQSLNGNLENNNQVNSLQNSNSFNTMQDNTGQTQNNGGIFSLGNIPTNDMMSNNQNLNGNLTNGNQVNSLHDSNSVGMLQGNTGQTQNNGDVSSLGNIPTNDMNNNQSLNGNLANNNQINSLQDSNVNQDKISDQMLKNLSLNEIALQNLDKSIGSQEKKQ